MGLCLRQNEWLRRPALQTARSITVAKEKKTPFNFVSCGKRTLWSGKYSPTVLLRIDFPSFPIVEFVRAFRSRSENQRLTHTAFVVGLRSAVIFDPPLWGVFCFQDVFFQLIYHSCLRSWPIQRIKQKLKSIWIKGSFNISKENSKRVSGNHIRSTSKLQVWSTSRS